MPYTQENRFITIDTPLGDDVLLLTGLSGREGISIPFEFELQLLSTQHDIPFDDIIGKSITVSMLLVDGETRFINGVVSRFSQGRGGGEEETGADPRFTRYSATIAPWFWLLTLESDIRIFQSLSAPEIIEQIFTEKDFRDYRSALRRSYGKRDYCVQYRESDFNFISRLLEEEGIFYFFEHEDGKHTLVLADDPQEHQPCPGQNSARCEISGGAWLEEEDVITGIGLVQELRPGKYTLNDWNFEAPNADLKVEAACSRRAGPGEREVYDYPGCYAKRDRGDQLTNTRMQEEEARITTLEGSSICRAFTSGYRFDLKDYYRSDLNNKSYVLTSMQHQASQGGDWESTSVHESDFHYKNEFACISFDVPFRPPRVTPKPVVRGTQTAIVSGPEGEEIHTDEYGRVKVQFHWDREGQRDENSSCWIRVAQTWAGARWGAVVIPRIGQEVIVDFLEGDPDRPIIIGCVYHANNRPPYKLPDEKTKSTIKTYSSKGGEGFNEIRFEDKKGEEQLFIHAEKNEDIRVKNDLYEWVGRDSHLIVKRDKVELLERDKHLTVRGDQNEKVDGTISIEAAVDMQEKVGKNCALEAGAEIHLKAGMNLIIEAGMQLTLKAGGGFIVIDPSGVTIQGTLVMINSGGAPGQGSGCSPAPPIDALEADTAKPGEKSKLPPPGTTPATPQAGVLKQASKAGTPLCAL